MCFGRPCCKFMLKHDIKIYFNNLRKLHAFVSSKIQHTETVNVTFLSSPDDGLLEFTKFEFRHISSFFLRLKKRSQSFR